VLDLAFRDSSPPARCAVKRLTLTDFRNYARLKLEFDGRPVVLTGANGAGKTNLLEAVSLLTPGRGLRRAGLGELAHANGTGAWAIAAQIEGALGPVEIGTGLEAPPVAGETTARVVRIDRVPQRSSTALAEHLAVTWLTPDLDGLLRGPAGDRRRFLDRLALALDPVHAGRASALERLNRDRNRLLCDGAPDRAWLAAIERELAETAIAVAATRAETVGRLAHTIEANRDPHSPFPHALIALEGEVESWLARDGSTAAEDRYRESLATLRPRDAAAGRATLGPHLSDLVVRHGPKGVPAAQASTGEQKALLIGLVLAHARLVASIVGRTPILLLDEIAAHLDAIRRAGLYEELDRLGAQAFMTGTDPAMFAAFGSRAQFFEVAEARVAARSDDP
jgi:DNA replication and repair protein RecF